MTQQELNSLVSAMHSLEVTLVERLARLEERVKGQAELDARLKNFEATCEAESKIIRDRTSRLFIGLIIVSLIAFGDGFLRVLPMI